MNNYFSEIVRELDNISMEATIMSQIREDSRYLFGGCRMFSWYEGVRKETKKARNVLQNYLDENDGIAKRKKKKSREKTESILISSKLYIEFFWQEYNKSHKMYSEKEIQRKFFEKMELDFERKWTESFTCTEVSKLENELKRFITEWREKDTDKDIAELKNKVKKSITEWRKGGTGKDIVGLKNEVKKSITEWRKGDTGKDIVELKSELEKFVTKWRENITEWKEDITGKEITELKDEVKGSIDEWRENHTQLEDIKNLHLEALHTAMAEFKKGLEMPEKSVEDCVEEILTPEILSNLLNYLKAKNSNGYARYIFTVAPIRKALWTGEPKSYTGTYFNKEYENNLKQLKEYISNLKDLYNEYEEYRHYISKYLILED